MQPHYQQGKTYDFTFWHGYSLLVSLAKDWKNAGLARMSKLMVFEMSKEVQKTEKSHQNHSLKPEGGGSNVIFPERWLRIREPRRISLALTIPFRSSQVVRSAAKNGGFWFHPGVLSMSSVREGQFILLI